MSWFTDQIDAMRNMADFITGGEIAAGAQPANAATMDFNTVQVKAVKGRLLYVVVTTPLAWVTSGQPTIQLFAARAAGLNPAANPTACALIGSAANYGPAAATSFANSLTIFLQSALAELANAHPFLGVRLVLPSALTAGALQPYFETSGA